jgi:hypothetical protein
MNGKSGIESNLVGVLAKQSGADAVKGAGSAQRIVHDAGLVAEDLARDPLDPLRHLGCRAPRERHQQNPARVGAADNQMGNTMRKRVRFTGTRTGDDQEGNANMTLGADAVLDGTALLWIERLEIGCGRRREHEWSPWSIATLDDSRWNRNEITCGFVVLP